MRSYISRDALICNTRHTRACAHTRPGCSGAGSPVSSWRLHGKVPQVIPTHLDQGVRQLGEVRAFLPLRGWVRECVHAIPFDLPPFLWVQKWKREVLEVTSKSPLDSAFVYPGRRAGGGIGRLRRCGCRYLPRLSICKWSKGVNIMTRGIEDKRSFWAVNKKVRGVWENGKKRREKANKVALSSTAENVRRQKIRPTPPPPSSAGPSSCVRSVVTPRNKQIYTQKKIMINILNT